MDVESQSPPAATPVVRSLIAGMVNLLYPPRCVHCGRFGADICENCLAAIDDSTDTARCPFCHAHWAGADNCPRCYRWEALDGANAAADYAAAARSIVRALKYQHVRSLASVMATRVQPLLQSQTPDVVFTVPLHPSRMRSRGFNQADLIASHLDLAAPPGALIRRRKTRPQFGLSHSERAHNVAGAFDYRGPGLSGARIIVLDDVITTGSTVNECARVLRDAGAVSVRALAFARASFDPYPQGAFIEL